jgi:ADP-ribosylglycohydrolase
MHKLDSWLNHNQYTAHGEVFDVGNTTAQAIDNYNSGYSISECGRDDIYSNGNGSLMRIIPLAFKLEKDRKLNNIQIYSQVRDVSKLTHAHKISVLGCFIYVDIVIHLIRGETFNIAIDSAIEDSKNISQRFRLNLHLNEYHRIMDKSLFTTNEQKISSSGYVVDTLEAALWCIYNTNNYKDAVLKAVNLGNDTDTVAMVAGGLAGLLYGYESIPKEWVTCLARKEWVESLCVKFNKVIKG